MRRTVTILVAVALAAAVFVPATGAAQPHKAVPTTPKEVTGTWSWVNNTWEEWKTTHKGVVYASGTETGTWTGTFEGTSTEEFGAQINPDGTLWALIRITFTGTVGEQSGTLEILTTAVMRNSDGTMHGTWTISSGTDGLANLRGQGTWVYVGPDPEHATYTGIIREYVPPA